MYIFSGQSDDSDDDIDVSQPQDILTLHNPSNHEKYHLLIYQRWVNIGNRIDASDRRRFAWYGI